MRRHIVSATAALVLLASVLPASAEDTIKIGDINSYKTMASSTIHYKRGAELAIEEINAAGGVLGRKFELISRDDGANPGDAVRNAEELISREQVSVLTGTILSNVGLAITDFAKQRKIFFLASAPLTDKIVWENGNRYTFRLRASTYSHAAALVPLAAQLKKKRWAMLYPNYEYGQAAVATFKKLLKEAQPDVEFVADMAPPFGKIDAGAVAQALADAKPDAIFNVLFGADLAKFVREGQNRDLFKGRQVVSLLTGEPEYLDPLKVDAPDNWLVTGYPWYAIDTPAHRLSSPPTRRNSATIRASRRSSATTHSRRSPPASPRPNPPTPTSSAPLSRACLSPRPRAKSCSERRTTSRLSASMSAAPASRTARAT
jgi:branched-chain amino acid transport system substrate-binding protein